jgi:hypothetical protein
MNRLSLTFRFSSEFSHDAIFESISFEILNLMRTRQPPRATKLRHWYRLARRLADVCGVMTWCHHYRANNKMADLLANLAMDTRASRQDVTETTGSTEPRYPRLQEFVNNDMAHWLLQRHMNGHQASEIPNLHI